MTSVESPYNFLALPDPPARGNVTAQVTDLLRQAIVTLDLQPGTTLDKGAICERLGVSRFPVSEALSRLQAEGLVDILPQRGSIVSLVKISDVLEHMLIRKALEAEAVRLVTARRSALLLPALERSLHDQKLAVERDDRRGFHQHDLEFHAAIFDDLQFSRLRTVIEQTRANLDRARRLILSPRRLGDTLAEHQAILDGIAGNDAAHATAAMRAHIDSVISELTTFATHYPDLFADGDDLKTVPDRLAFPFG